ncbi:hypothetical protein [Pseudomonas synxantha]|uniref:hypothetical protein n=1 Tax=Pseudomonas synxantha TaxID=47883 RepID=UPI001C0A8C18|nr:hypothetical protein [Pseudomonas synxantha]VCU67869.1 Hypothetical new protein [Pseudomonas synxantha]
MNVLNNYRTCLRFLLLVLGAFVVGGQQARAAACEIRLGQSEVDFGQIQHPGVNPPLDDQRLYLAGKRYVSLNVSCPTSSRLLLMLRGDSLGEHFRFSAQSRLKVRLSDAVLDGRAVDLALVRAVGEVPGQPASAIDVAPGSLIVPVSAGLAAEGASLSLQVEVSPGVAMEEFRGGRGVPLRVA